MIDFKKNTSNILQYNTCREDNTNKANKENLILNKFSNHIFWNCDLSLYDVNIDKKRIILRVLEYGMESDEILLFKLYSREDIKSIALNNNDLSDDIILYINNVLFCEGK